MNQRFRYFGQFVHFLLNKSWKYSFTLYVQMGRMPQTKEHYSCSGPQDQGRERIHFRGFN